MLSHILFLSGKTVSGGVTDQGAKKLALLKNLKYLKFEQLKNIKNPKEVLEYLRDALPNCEIEYHDAEESAWVFTSEKEVSFIIVKLLSISFSNKIIKYIQD